MNIQLGPPELTDLKPRITVIGIGGAGCNAINNMIATELDGVEFVVANTDAQSLGMSRAERRIQLGTNLTEGLGAGARPEVGEAAAREAEADIRAEIAGSHMVFIAAGMGGGTGTGAASVVAEIARDLGILTVGIVSKPFQFEGARRMRTAEAGIDALERVVDTLIVIPNQNLFRIANERTTFAEAFRLADQVLYSGIACIVDLIVKEGLINLDFADVQAVMKGMGTAMMGTGEAHGEERAMMAAEEAIANPLLDNMTLSGAQGLLVSIVGGDDLTLYEVDTAASHIRKEVAPEANIIVGATIDSAMGQKIRVSIVASGMAELAPGEAARGGAPAAMPRPQQRPANGAQSAAAMAPRMNTPAVDRQAQSRAAAAERAHDERFGQYEASAQYADNYAESQAAGHGGQPAAPVRQNDADLFARALSEAMHASASDDGHNGFHQASWKSQDGVMVEEGFIDPSQPKRNPPPLPGGGDAPMDDPRNFEPARPAGQRRSQSRVPDVSEFPDIAQRAYFAKLDAEGRAPTESARHDHGARAAPARFEELPKDQGLLRGFKNKVMSRAQEYVNGSSAHDDKETDGGTDRGGLFGRLTGGGRR